MKKKGLSLSEQISDLSNPTPIEAVDEFLDDDTSARVVDYTSEDEDREDTLAALSQPSALRKKNALAGLEDDTRYKGSKTSRRNWLDQEWDEGNDYGEGNDDSDDEEEDAEEEESEDDDIAEQQKEMSRKFQQIAKKLAEDDGDDSLVDSDDDGEVDEEEDYAEDDDDGDDNDETDDDDEDVEEDEESEDENETEDSGVAGFSQGSLADEVDKGKAVKAQLGLWDSFMEARIKLQKALGLANQLPQHDAMEAFQQEGGAEVNTLIKNSQKELCRLLTSLTSLQDILLEQNPETQRIVMGEEPGTKTTIDNKNDDGDDDEEIVSDTDEEEGDSSDQPKGQKVNGREQGSKGCDPGTSKKRKLDTGGDLGEQLAKRHKSFTPYRNSTIQKWYEKTRLSTGKMSKKSFSGFERSALVQIQQILQDEHRLIQRTQLRRSEYTVLGQQQREEEKEEGEKEEDETNRDLPSSANQHLKHYDEEIFDDDDFYHQLLRELIEKRTSSTTDPIQLTRQWLQVQKLRSKVKRQVDTKASKGRKIRYDVHQKLVSFMAPREDSVMSSEARSELFKSLFGQNAFGASPEVTR